jgi:molybdenum cofactor synthesis domain-containing protein
MSKTVTASVLLIGDELLSGRTQDANLKAIADFLSPLGVQVREARVVPDIQAEIAEALNALRGRYDYVFTTGGIGPTHDDITADAVAAAFGVSVTERADALAVMAKHYGRALDRPEDANRRRMARIPDGARLIVNAATGAPGFQIGNVFVMAGVPSIMRAMLEDLADRIEGGAVTLSATVGAAGLRESDLAGGMEAVQRDMGVSVGSYPYFSPDGSGVNIVARSTDAEALARAAEALEALVREKGGTPVRG